MEDTIAAICTPPGAGAVAVIRISGSAALPVLTEIFSSSVSGFSGFKPRFLHHGHIKDENHALLDEVLAVWMPGPRTFTGEDVVEIHSHAGAAARLVLELLFRRKVRPARAGEFTKRAFLNNRLDLSRAEAVAEVVSAASAPAAMQAQARLHGLMAGRVEQLRGALLSLRQDLCLAVDFPEEEVEVLDVEACRVKLGEVRASMNALLEAYERSKLWREGATVVLAGLVNAGKSSLFNALLGRSRAIVSARPGTTRDFIEENISLDGLPLRLVDTAGWRGWDEDTVADEVDALEAEGQHLAGELFEKADLLLLVIDPTRETDCFTGGGVLAPFRHKTIVVVNKMDLLPGRGALPEQLRHGALPMSLVSARTGVGLEEMIAALKERLLNKEGAEVAELSPNLRQKTAIQQAMEEVALLEAGLSDGLPYDLLSVHLDLACAKLAEVTGEMLPEDVLDSIFASFCIGK